MSGSFSLMGIVNVTPDSFSDGGQFFDTGRAVDHGLQLMKEGADILDIGGESSRPGATPIPAEEEIRRVLPVIKALKDHGAIVSVDTRNAATMRAAIEAGADIINDISSLTHDPGSLSVVSESRVRIVLMHLKGTPETMQGQAVYGSVVNDVMDYLQSRLEVCVGAGIGKDRIIIDPGIGFAKLLPHNLITLRKIADFQSLHVPILLGVSRKRFIEGIVPDASVDRRLPGSLSSVLWAFHQGVTMFRVHDVKETRQALLVWDAIRTAHSGTGKSAMRRG